MSRLPEIPTSALKLEHIPPDGASWYAIDDFALTLNGYEEMGSLEGCAAVGRRVRQTFEQDGTLPESALELRVALFFEQRSFRHGGDEPDERDMAYLHAILRRIREVIGGRKVR